MVAGSSNNGAQHRALDQHTTIDGDQCTTTMPTAAALPENNEASAELTTANGGTFTSSSARLSSQSRYRSLDQ